MADTFCVGDIVQLKSGGERMTVEKVEGDDIACVWREGKKLQRDVFVAATLKKTSPPAPAFMVIR